MYMVPEIYTQSDELLMMTAVIQYNTIQYNTNFICTFAFIFTRIDTLVIYRE